MRENKIMLGSSFCHICTVFTCGDSRVWLGMFFEKLAHFLALTVKSESSLQRRFSLRN